MISIDLAKKLKDAGLKPVCTDLELFWLAEVGEVMYAGAGYEPEPEDVWLPRLDRLLAEIERRGWEWVFYLDNGKFRKYTLSIDNEDECRYKKFISKSPKPENAVGAALLWILEREKEAEQNA